VAPLQLIERFVVRRLTIASNEGGTAVNPSFDEAI